MTHFYLAGQPVPHLMTDAKVSLGGQPILNITETLGTIGVWFHQ